LDSEEEELSQIQLHTNVSGREDKYHFIVGQEGIGIKETSEEEKSEVDVSFQNTTTTKE